MERRAEAVAAVFPHQVSGQVNVRLVLMLGVFFSELMYIISSPSYALLHADQEWP
jgi:hypothetical protein